MNKTVWERAKIVKMTMRRSMRMCGEKERTAVEYQGSRRLRMGSKEIADGKQALGSKMTGRQPE